MLRHYPLNPATGLEDASQLPWKQGVPQTGIEGSYPPFGLCTDPQDEILNAIAGSGQAQDSNVTQLLQAIGRGIFLGTLTGGANALTASLPGAVAIPALTPGLLVTGIVGAATNTGAATFNLGGFAVAAGAKNIVTDNGDPLVANDLPAGAPISLRYDGANWRLSALSRGSVVKLIAANTRVKLSAATTFYLHPTNGNDGNNGLSADTPFRTMSGAIFHIIRDYDSVGYGVTLQLAPGIYEPIYLDGIAGLALTINGGASPSLASAGSYIIDNTNQNNLPCVSARAGSRVTVNGVKLQGPQGAFFATDGGSKIVHSNCIIATTGTHMSASYGALITPLTAYQILAGAPEHFLVSTKGIIVGSGLTINIPSGVSFSNAFAAVNAGELDLVTGVTFTGPGAGTGSTGKRFSLDLMGLINVAGAGVNFFPGNVAGTGAGVNGSLYA